MIGDFRGDKVTSLHIGDFIDDDGDWLAHCFHVSCQHIIYSFKYPFLSSPHESIHQWGISSSLNLLPARYLSHDSLIAHPTPLHRVISVVVVPCYYQFL